MAVPFVIPAQSILTESAISAGVGATSLTGGFPWGARPPPFCVYPGIVGTATPATAGSWPHPSVPPAPIEDPPFLCKPLRLVQLDSMFIVAGCRTAYSATVRSAAAVPPSALTVLPPCDRTPYPRRWGYVVRSHGVSTVKALRGTPAAERTVAEYAVWQPATINMLSSWTSLSGLHKNGGSSMGAGGTDGCGQLPAVAGVAVPTIPGYTQNGGGLAPQGNPPVKDVAPTPAEMADSVKIDWAGITNG